MGFNTKSVHDYCNSPDSAKPHESKNRTTYPPVIVDMLQGLSQEIKAEGATCYIE